MTIRATRRAVVAVVVLFLATGAALSDRGPVVVIGCVLAALVAALFREDGPSSTTPVPGAERLTALVDEFRRAGVAVSYEVLGEPDRLASTVSVTVYRVLQER